MENLPDFRLVRANDAGVHFRFSTVSQYSCRNPGVMQRITPGFLLFYHTESAIRKTDRRIRLLTIQKTPTAERGLDFAFGKRLGECNEGIGKKES